MQFFIFHILIGSAIAYLMQSQIKWVAERITSIGPLQAVLKILLDALMTFSWIIVAPAILFIKFHLQRKDNGSNKD